MVWDNWTLCLDALVFAALSGPIAVLLTPLAHASALALNIVAALLAAAPIVARAVHAVVVPQAATQGARGYMSVAPPFILVSAHPWSRDHGAMVPRHGPVRGTMAWCGVPRVATGRRVAFEGRLAIVPLRHLPGRGG